MYPSFKLSEKIKGQEAFITTDDGTKIYTVVAGTGPKTVLLAHGYGFDASEWNIIVPQLTDLGYRVIAFDQRGHGASSIGTKGISSAAMASDYKAVIDHFGLKDAILVGHSMGGFLSMKFLLDYPNEQFSSLKACVLMATFAGDVLKHNFQNRFQIPLIQWGILQKMLNVGFIGKAFAKSLMGDEKDPEIVRVVPEIFLQQNHQQLVPILKAFGNESYYSQLHNIKIPCVVVIGDKDKTTPPFHTDDLVRLIPNATRLDVPNKGHGLNWEAPEMIVKAIQSLDK